MKFLIIGGTGFIGGRVAEMLSENGHGVTVFHRGRGSHSVGRRTSVVRGDRNSSDDLARAIRAADPDVIIDLILYTEQQAQALARAVERKDLRLVVISSADVYRNYDGFRRAGNAPPDPVPLREDAPLRESRYPYRGSGLPFEWADDYDKIFVEQRIRECAVPATVLRLPAVYGPGDSRHRVGQYLERMDDNQVLKLPRGKSTWRWTRGYVSNVAGAITLAATDERAVGATYNVGEEEARRELEWVEAIAETAGWTGSIVVHEDDGQVAASDFSYELYTDTSRIRRELGFRDLAGFRGALAATVRWERSQLSDSRGNTG